MDDNRATDFMSPFAADGGKMKRAVRQGLLILALIGAGLSHALNSALAQSQDSRPVAIAAPEGTAWRVTPAREPPLRERTTADLPIWRTVALGAQPGVVRLREALQTPPFSLGDAASEIVGKSLGGAREVVGLVVLSVSEIGFDENGATLADVHARARQLGFRLCPPEVGPALRLAYRDQPVGEFLHIAMKPIVARSGEPLDFTVGNGGAGLALMGGEAAPDLVVSWTTRFVFVVPGSADLNAMSKQ
jgi:hypothetical protein